MNCTPPGEWTPIDEGAASADHIPLDLRVAGRIARCVVIYVHRALGDAAVSELERRAGIGEEALHASYDGSWISADQLSELADAAAEICGDREIGRRAGEVSFDILDELYPMLLSTGSVNEAVALAVSLSNRTRTAEGYSVVSSDERGVVVHSRANLPSRFACEMSAGFWSGVPTLFGAHGYVTEPRCQTRGDERCEYHIRWTEPDVHDHDDLARSRQAMETQLDRFEVMHSMAAELAQQETVGALLQLIAARAGGAVTAPSAVLAVRLVDGEDLSIGYHGLTEPEANEVVLALEGGMYEGEPSAIVAPVRSPRRSYGHLIVFNQPDTVFTDGEQRMLTAFASFATASIETAAALESARIERDRAESLLGLARVLADVGSTEEVAQRIAEAMPTVLPCERSGVLLWDPSSRQLRVAGAWPVRPEELAIEPIDVDRYPGALQLVETLRPVLVTAETATGADVAILRELDVRTSALAPIVVRGELIGAVNVVVSDVEADRDAWVEETLRRLAGFSDHAASALDNSALLDEVRHQALHDPLTGLPNRTLAEDRVRHALEVAERLGRWVTLLFVDLDEFKAVNDRLGHAAGDDLLREAAVRLRACVRTSDTVCRLGGDEFLVLLENTSGDVDGSRAAEEIIAALREPFVVRGEIARVSASVGITSAPGRGTHYEELLARADEAMYEVKRRGRDGWAVFAS